MHFHMWCINSNTINTCTGDGLTCRTTYRNVHLYIPFFFFFLPCTIISEEENVGAVCHFWRGKKKIGIPFTFNAWKFKQVKCKLHPGHNYTALLTQHQFFAGISTDSMLTKSWQRTQSDAQAECMPAPARQPEQEAKAVMRSQACNLYVCLQSTGSSNHFDFSFGLVLNSSLCCWLCVQTQTLK